VSNQVQQEATEHPAFREMVARYKAARDVWRANPRLRAAAADALMGQREYCERYIAARFDPLTWTDSSTAWEVPQGLFDKAFEQAGKELEQEGQG
jgi:hypothetical protein